MTGKGASSWLNAMSLADQGLALNKQFTLNKQALQFDFLGVNRIPWKDKNAVYRLQIPALVLEIFKFEKWVKYANEMTDDIIHSTQYYINRQVLPFGVYNNLAWLWRGIEVIVPVENIPLIRIDDCTGPDFVVVRTAFLSRYGLLKENVNRLLWTLKEVMKEY